MAKEPALCDSDSRNRPKPILFVVLSLRGEIEISKFLVLIVEMMGLKSILALSLLILLPERANSDEVADAVRAAREKLLENFSKEELAALSDEQINHIIERDTLPQARKIVS